VSSKSVYIGSSIPGKDKGERMGRGRVRKKKGLVYTNRCLIV